VQCVYPTQRSDTQTFRKIQMKYNAKEKYVFQNSLFFGKAKPALDDLIPKGLVKLEIIDDPWGETYHYKTTEAGLELGFSIRQFMDEQNEI